MSESNGRATLILAVDDLARAQVQVPEWANVGDLYVREWDGSSREKVERAAQEPNANLTPLIVCLSLCDAVGKRIFSDTDLDALAGKNAKVLDRIAMAAWTHNGMPLPAEAPGK